ncbi:MAG TPA: proton-conducting transporter membrane subunit, partial [Gemmatimonadales bacterium]|nr:proton-conducting transporter membrane subunit [Gemmatimonadales bacterium]
MPHPTQSFALLPLLAPLAWLGVALAARRAPGPRPRPLLALADAAGAFTLGVAALSGMLAWRIGPATSPLLGAGGVGLAVRLDALGAVMLALVAFIGAVVVRYSRRYLDGEARQARFVGGLALTLAAVMLLVVAGTLWQLAAAWIGTSLALHRLLLFYPERPGARRAARKKFVVARLGDAALLAALALLALAYGTTDLGTLLARAQDALASGVLPAGTTVAALLLVASAALKSAQFPTYGWLVEVMETPTPVSALLHAGILNGGPFLVARLAPAVSGAPAAMAALVLLGGATAAIASLAMTTQPSVKVALAYSSAAHMGFSLLLCGLGAFPLAVLHVVAHSCYTAHAFLPSASAVEGAGAGARATPPATAPRILLGLLTA